MSYTLSQVAKKVGTKPRTLQLWNDYGILEAETGTQGAGTGVHRRFDTQELHLAALLVHFESIGVPRGTLKQISTLLRAQLTARSDLARSLREAIGRAIAGKGLNLLYYIHAENELEYQVVVDTGKMNVRPHTFEALFGVRHAHIGVINLNAVMKDVGD